MALRILGVVPKVVEKGVVLRVGEKAPLNELAKKRIHPMHIEMIYF